MYRRQVQKGDVEKRPTQANTGLPGLEALGLRPWKRVRGGHEVHHLIIGDVITQSEF